MAVVRVRGPLKQLAGGRSDHPTEGITVEETLRELERANPALAGWILDERGLIRRHINVFVNGEQAREDTSVESDDRIEVLPAISGGDASMTQLLIGTRKGLIVLAGEPGGEFEVKARAFAGQPVEYAIKDPRTSRLFASLTHPIYGPKIWYAEDPSNEWQQADGVALPEGGDAALERIWVIVAGEEEGTLYAGGDPGVLFESRDGGTTWELNRALWEHPTRSSWEPGGGGLCLHSIVPWPGDPNRLALAISAAGVWLSDDGGREWRRGNEGLVARYLPEDAPPDSVNLCVHRLHRAPKRPERMFIQFHGGVYRSDDAGESWTEIGAGLPSDFGFPLVLDPGDPDSAYVIPLSSDEDRVTPDGRVRVYETRDAGTSWTARGEGLPHEGAFLTILRQAFDRAREDGRLELYFGSTSGDVFGSADAGASWFTAAAHLPPVYSVSVIR
jgi:molybdopterin converting factor small subunit